MKVVLLENRIKAMFKSLLLDSQKDTKSKVRAYQASVYLGFSYIPPTVFRRIDDIRSSLQLLDNLKIFYFVFDQWNLEPHNLLIYPVEPQIYQIAIDNSSIQIHLHIHYGKLQFVRIFDKDKPNTNNWNEPCPLDYAKIIDNPSCDRLNKLFSNKPPQSFYRNFKYYYNKPLKYLIYKNSLWKQYRLLYKNFSKSCIEKYLKKALLTLDKLNLKGLKKNFSSAQGCCFFDRFLLAKNFGTLQSAVNSHCSTTQFL